MLEILIVDDDDATRMSVGYALNDAGHHVTEAVDGAEALALTEQRVFDVAICDVRLPKVDGLTLFRHIRRQAPATAVILMTAFAAIPDAVAALREGAYDYVTKPFDAEEFTLRVIGRIAERRALRQELEQARAQLAGRDVGATIVGHSPAIVRLLDRVDTIAQSDAPVLVHGEPGTGKELVARTLHARSPRRTRPFVTVHCGAFSELLLDQELFGYDHAPSGSRRREGRFRAAEGGTLFLAEGGDIPLPIQAKLLHVLREGKVEVPGGEAAPVDVRIITSTTLDLHDKVLEGAFREDLFFRLNVLDLALPPLRERKGDLPLLLEYFRARLTPAGKVPPGISPRAWAALTEYRYPGNVREFSHAIERALVLSHGSEIDLEHLPPEISGASGPVVSTPPESLQPLALASKEFERQYLLRALSAVGGRRTAAAELLGISRKNLWEKLRQHGISDELLVTERSSPPPPSSDAPEEPFSRPAGESRGS
jgi:DNA-binding NtrC family response regulator